MPQVERTRTLMLEAATRLLDAEGPDAVTHLRIAEEAGVSRATVYRHWADRADLLVDLLATGVAPIMPLIPVGGSVRDRVLGALAHAATILDDDGAQTFLLLLTRSRWDERFRAARRQMTEAARDALVGLLDEGVAAGEFELAVPTDLAVDQLFGPILARRLMGDEDVDIVLIERLVDSVLRAPGRAP